MWLVDCYKPVSNAVDVCSHGTCCTNSGSKIFLCVILNLHGTNVLSGDQPHMIKWTASVSGSLLVSIVRACMWEMTIITNHTNITKAWRWPSVCVCEHLSHFSCWQRQTEGMPTALVFNLPVMCLFIWEHFNVKLCCSLYIIICSVFCWRDMNMYVIFSVFAFRPTSFVVLNKPCLFCFMYLYFHRT